MAESWVVNGETFVHGQEVTLEVPWRDGRVRAMSGTLLTVVDGEAFVETELGCVAGDADTLEHAS